MKTLFRILGTAAAVAVTGAAIVALDKILNQIKSQRKSSLLLPHTLSIFLSVSAT